jgi:hypothetical protein
VGGKLGEEGTFNIEIGNEVFDVLGSKYTDGCGGWRISWRSVGRG